MPDRSNTRSIVVLLTRKCQLNCSYCRMTHSDKDLSLTDLKGAIDLLFTSKEEELELQFFGGEPLLKFDLLREGVEYADGLSAKTGKKIRYVVTTNGLLLSEKIVDFFDRKDILWMLSLDGGAEACTARGISKKSYEQIISNSKLILKSKQDYLVNMVVNQALVDGMEHSFTDLVSEGFRRFQITFSFGELWSTKNAKKYLEGLRRIKDSINSSKYAREIALLVETSDIPPFASPVITVDTDSKVYVGCSLVIENTLPSLNTSFFRGELSAFSDILELATTRKTQFDKMMLGEDLPAAELEIIRNNLALGKEELKAMSELSGSDELKNSTLSRLAASKEKSELIILHEKNFKRLSEALAISARSDPEKLFAFYLPSPKKAREKGLAFISAEEAAPYLRRATKGIRNYVAINMPECLFSDKNVINPHSTEKVKSAICTGCENDKSCGGVFLSSKTKNDIEALVPLSKEKKELIDCISRIATEGTPKMFSLGLINSTTICNLSCRFCNEGDIHKNPKHIPLPILKETILKLKAKGVSSINFMGGEVTTRPDFFELLDFVKSESLKAGVATNCLNFADSTFCEETLKRTDFMEVSMHYPSEEAFFQMTGSRNYSKYLQGLLNLSTLNKSYHRMIVINILMSRYNYSQLPKLARFAIESFGKNDAAVHFRMIDKEGSARKNQDCIVPFLDARPYLLSALEILRESKMSVKVDNIPLCLLEGYEEYSRALLESVQKMNQYYFNKMLLSEEVDFEKYHNKHLYSTPNHPSCRQCAAGFLCKEAKEEFFDIAQMRSRFSPIKKDLRPIIEGLRNNLFLRYEV